MMLSHALEHGRSFSPAVSQPIAIFKDSTSEPPDLSNSVTIPSHVCFPAFSGGCGDVWLGVWKGLDGKQINVSLNSYRKIDPVTTINLRLQYENFGLAI